MDVAPNGRIDVLWNDTRYDPDGFNSILFYSFSSDGGQTWSPDQAVSPSFDPHIGFPQQNKIGDYYDLVSVNEGVHVAYSATFNSEQDVYYLWIETDVTVPCPSDLNGDHQVTPEDLNEAIRNWPGEEFPGDVNENGKVEILDLLTIMAAFGPC